MPLIKTAIPRLRRRLQELEAVEIDDWDEGVKNSLDGLQTKVEDTLVGVFGSDTVEYKRFRVDRFMYQVHMNTAGTPPREWTEGYRRAVDLAISKIKTAIEVLEERLEDTGETGEARALRAYDGLELHEHIGRAAGQLYRDGHYANAVEDAVKALKSVVRLHSGLDFDGASLMQRAFGGDQPLLRFNGLADQPDKDEQQGYMMMFWGAVSGLRNPRAHKLIRDDAEHALEFIAFVSLLAKLLDRAEKAKT